MTLENLTYIGIDVQAAQKPFYYAALDNALEMIACGHGRMGDILAYLAGQSSAMAAINGPTWAPQPHHYVSQQGFFGDDHQAAHGGLRQPDHELSARKLPVVPVPAVGKKIPLWMERSLELVQELKNLGYMAGSGVQADRTFFETSTDASFHLITEALPYDSRSMEGRLQRQVLLHEFGFALKDPMAFLEEFTRHRLLKSTLPLEQIGAAHELRALMAAATAWLTVNRSQCVEKIGQDIEGGMILIKEFSRK